MPSQVAVRLLAEHGCRLLFSGTTDMEERILVVDDDRDTADMMARLIRTLGYDAKPVYDGMQAVEEVITYAPDMALIGWRSAQQQFIFFRKHTTLWLGWVLASPSILSISITNFWAEAFHLEWK